MSNPRKLSDPDRIKKVLAFISDSLADYMAARTLLLSDLPKQAAILSSTAIEKACKAVLAFHGNSSHGHLQKAHWNAVKAFDPRLFGSFDTEFLSLNRKAYALRYTEDLPHGFNLVVATREFLAALDETLMNFHRSFRVGDAPHQKSLIQHHLDDGDTRLLLENHIAAGVTKESFVLSRPQLVYEVRSRQPRGLLEVLYVSTEPAKRPGYMREACRVVDAAKEIYEFSHQPLGAVNVSGVEHG